MIMSKTLKARYLIETSYDLEEAAQIMAGEQSSGTFLKIPGETASLKARHGAEVFVIEPMGVFLDPAAPLAGVLPKREDITYFASHPSHPSVFNWEPSEDQHFDYFGGIAAKQTIVCALIQGEDHNYETGEQLAKTIYAPVTVSHRITIEQMGILEPARSETFAATLVTKMKEAVDIVVSKGVPKAAAYDFFLGHINIELAVVFGQLPGGQFSDAALKAIKLGEDLIFKENWKDIFEKDSVAEQIKAIT